MCILAFWLYYERIIYAEEAFLDAKFGEEFRNWATTTPTFIPRLRNWRPPSLPFSWKNVLKREYSGLLGIVVAFTLFEVLGDGLAEGEWQFGPGWIVWFGAGLFAYLVLLVLKRKTALLTVAGR